MGGIGRLGAPAGGDIAKAYQAGVAEGKAGSSIRYNCFRHHRGRTLTTCGSAD
jgi:hypothetical protein